MRNRLINFCKDWLDTLVVALSVVMAFRTYFYEPFNIPTGCMIPTLYGNHSVAAKPSDDFQTVESAFSAAGFPARPPR